jgi:hypothetical protein
MFVTVQMETVKRFKRKPSRDWEMTSNKSALPTMKCPRIDHEVQRTLILGTTIAMDYPPGSGRDKWAPATALEHPSEK